MNYNAIGISTGYPKTNSEKYIVTFFKHCKSHAISVCNITHEERKSPKCNNNAISGKDAGRVSNHLARKISMSSQWDH